MNDEVKDMVKAGETRIRNVVKQFDDIFQDCVKDETREKTTCPDSCCPETPTQHEPRRSFEDELTDLINKHSMENCSNTPDYILAAYLCRCLEAFDITSNIRNDWFSSE